MGTASKFIKTSAIYMLGSALTKLAAFLLTPLYTTYLSPEELGYFNLTSNIVLVAVPFFSMEVWTGILRYILEARDQSDKEKFAGAGFYIATASAVLLTLIFAILLIFTKVNMLGYIYIYCIAQCFVHVYESFARGFGGSGLFVISGIASAFVTIVSNVILIVFLGFGSRALFLGFATGALAQIAIIEIKVRALKFFLPKYFSRTAFWELIRFSMPLSLGTVCYWFSTGYSSVMISRTQGLSENGMYAIAGRFVGVLMLFNQVFNLASQEMLYKTTDGKKGVYNASMNYYFKFLSLCTLAMIALTRVVYPYMVNGEFTESLRFIPMYFLASFVSYFAIYLGNYFLKEKKTGQNALSLLVPGLINVVVLHLLVGGIGAEAANIGLLLGYLASAAMRLIQLRAFTEMRLDYRYFIYFIGLCVVTLFFFFRLNLLWNFIWACVIGLVFLWVFRRFVSQIWVFLNGIVKYGRDAK